MSELQRLTDRVGERLGRSVAIDDTRMRLQSHSPHYGAVDEQRLASILRRRANDEAIGWGHRHGIQHATGWVRLPANSDLQMLSRVCVPIRFRTLHLGYLWIIDPDGSLTHEQLDFAEQSASEAADVIYRAGLVSDLQSARGRELLRDLLNDDAAIRTQAVSGLAEDALLEIDRPVQVLVLDTSEPAGEADRTATADLALTHARRLLPTRRSLHLTRPHHALLVVAVDRDLRATDLAAQVQADYLDGLGRDTVRSARVGIGDPVAALVDAQSSYRQALQAVRVSRVLGLDPIVEWSRLGIYRLLAELNVEQAALDLLHPALDKLAKHDAGGQLLDTLETFLDLAGDVKASSEQLLVHRTTLYHRLARIEEIGEVNLARGSDRLALHLGLKIGHLYGRYAHTKSSMGKGATEPPPARGG
ncbi:PucR family transcriptional regulator [Embleya scabrispora]|uniref:PucR family transcriptional regulator n=1 Tax=Embleya scabrispora TaxID=159449 RepID=UPI00035E7451|nr:helix-turn-helix domain-containing protein [Embleya scabrispora]MYS86913.1 CdaR family transcriptional regulator [Streptomyces sp. SID5474]